MTKCGSIEWSRTAFFGPGGTADLAVLGRNLPPSRGAIIPLDEPFVADASIRPSKVSGGSRDTTGQWLVQP